MSFVAVRELTQSRRSESPVVEGDSYMQEGKWEARAWARGNERKIPAPPKA